MNTYNCIADDVTLGKDVRLSKFTNLYGCTIGEGTKIGAFVEIQKNASVGTNCKISSHSFVCEGVTIEDNVFIGHGVMFINDRYPRATTSDGALQTDADWRVEHTVIRKGASLGSGVTILSNVEVGEGAIVGAGSVVTRNVPPHSIVAGNPARMIRLIRDDMNDVKSESPIPFLDLVTPHLELEHELIGAFRKGLRSAAFVGGSAVEDFEKAFAAFCETDHALGVSNGTDALRFALMACGIEPGDVVLTVPNTFIATTEAISQVGAIPDFIDIDEHTYNMSAARLEEYLREQCEHDSTGRLVSLRSGRPVTAIVPVHLYGQMADMDSIMRLAEMHGLTVIEDACQAHGAQYFSHKHNRWMKAGSMGRAAAFSFYPGKNLGACGEAGAVTTNDAGVAAQVKLLRDHGQAKKYYHDIEGFNGRIDAIQAAFLHTKLPHLEEWNQSRRARASDYNRLLAAQESLGLPYEPSWSRAVYHLYVVRTQNREGLIEHLKAAGIGTGIHYPIPLHLQKAYMARNYGPGSFPAAERAATEILSLPMFPQLTGQQQARVVKEILAFHLETSESQAEGEEAPLEATIRNA